MVTVYTSTLQAHIDALPVPYYTLGLLTIFPCCHMFNCAVMLRSNTATISEAEVCVDDAKQMFEMVHMYMIRV